MVREAVLTPHALTYALLSAHLIVFWLSQDSNVTPPVALFGLYAFAAALEGFMEMRIGFWVRVLTFGCAGALLWPASWWVHLAALAGLFVSNWRESRRAPTGPPAMAV
jgi:TRAP-type uncharacterized transport system fused permease subunit